MGFEVDCNLPVKNTFIHFEDEKGTSKKRLLRCVKSEPPVPLIFEVAPLRARRNDLGDLGEVSPSSQETKFTFSLSDSDSSTPSCPSPATRSEGETSEVTVAPPVFTFTLRRADDVALGLNAAISRRNELVVESVTPWTALDSWNRFQVAGAQDRSVYPGDRVLSVNGHVCPLGMLQECQMKQLLKMEIMRAGGLLEFRDGPFGERSMFHIHSLDQNRLFDARLEPVSEALDLHSVMGNSPSLCCWYLALPCIYGSVFFGRTAGLTRFD